MKKNIRSTTAILCLCGALALPVRAGHSATAPATDAPFRLVGTAIFQGDASALVEINATGEERFINLNDAVEGYKVSEIKADQVVLENSAQRLVLSSADAAPSVQLGAVHDPITIYNPMKTLKQAPTPAVKYPTHADSTARSSRSSLSSSGLPSFAVPIDGRVVSGFGKRQDPWGGGTKTHYGVDIAAPQGTLIRAAADGLVEEADYKGLLGNNVKIDNGDGYETIYGHMYRIAAKAGEHVQRGDVIGYEGSTGHSTGPHLHFEVRLNGAPIDPCRILPCLEK